MARRRQKIWITRAQPAAEATAERVRALGHEALVAPLLAVRALEDAQIDLGGVAALAFTSANGVRAFADLSPERALRVFAVGAATAQAARAAGFKLVLSADGDVEALAEGIGQRRTELRGAVLHPGAAELAGDLMGALERQGVTARQVTLYETLPVKLEADGVNAYFDVTHPYTGKSETIVDLWAGYRWKFGKNFRVRSQLNVRNVFAKDKLIVVTAEPDGTPAGYKIPEPRTFTLTNTLEF